MAIQTKYQLVADVSSFDRAMANIKRQTAATAVSAQKQFANLNSSVLACTGSFAKLAAGLAGGAALGAFTAVVGDGINTIKEFEKATSNLAGVLGTTPQQISALTEQAKLLGSTTAFSASQVTQLQTELAKLGFNQTEIQASTKAVLDLSSATGADLGEAASLAGATLRAFNLDASEMSRVTSVLAVSTTKSALDFGKLQTSMSTVAPVAKAFGFSVEDTVAMLGKLSDAGFDASSAATATRNILLNLANGNGKLAQSLGRPVHNAKELSTALIELRNKGVDLNEALAMTDKRSVAAFETFLTSAEGVGKLSEELTGCNEELGKMVDTMTDNLQGSLDNLSSAWEGLMLAFSDSKGVFRSIVDGLTGIVQALTDVINGVDGAMTKIENKGKADYDANRGKQKEEIQRRLNLAVDSRKNDYRINGINKSDDDVRKEVYEEERKRIEAKAAEDAKAIKELDRQIAVLENIKPQLAANRDYGRNAEKIKSAGIDADTVNTWKKQYGGDVSRDNVEDIKNSLKSTRAKKNVDAYSSAGDLKIFDELTAPKQSTAAPSVEDVLGFDDSTIEGLEKHIQALRKEWKGTADGAKRSSLYLEIKDLEEKLKELKGTATTTSKAVKEVGAEGSLSFYKNELEKANRAYEMATDDAGRESARKLIEHYKAAIADIEREPVKIDVVTRVQQSQSVLASAPSTTDAFGSEKSAEEMYNAYSSYIDKLKADFESLGETIAEALSQGADVETLAPLQQQWEQTGKAVDDATKKQQQFRQSVIDSRDAKAALEETQAGISAIGSAFGAMGNLGNDTFSNMMNGFSDLMGAVVKLIPMLMASSMASGTEKVARTSTTWYEIIPGIAAVVAAISGIFGSLKFASGGIVGGSHYNADRVPALVQSGEMILNKRQQRNLFAMLDGAPAGGGSSVSTMRLSGRDLVATINTQNKLTSKLK